KRQGRFAAVKPQPRRWKPRWAAAVRCGLRCGLQGSSAKPVSSSFLGTTGQ
ncbi:hypothetical protein BV898_20323, partial [Hypsibius exemplaris]